MARPKNRSLLARPRSRREPYDRVLIVCEGSKTEPKYLQELIAHHQLSSANVQVVGDSGSAPGSVVEHAIRLFARDRDYDSVFCVFDRDGHSTFHAAVERIRSKRLARLRGGRQAGAASFEAITSVPCFEYWLLLHFTYTTMDLPRFADVEQQMQAIPELATYDKGQEGLFSATCSRLETALENADRANRDASACGADNPTTRMPVLVRYLQRLADRKIR